MQNRIITMPRTNMNSLESAPADKHSETNPFAEIPLTALSRRTRKQLSKSLNFKKILRSEEGFERDWRGIASLAHCDENAFNVDDPMEKVLVLWCSNNPKTATLTNLERFLGIIDRWDVCDDIYENLVEDAKNYNTKLYKKTLVLASESDVASTCCEILSDVGFVTDPNILTQDDVHRAQKGQPPQNYDAFVLFAEADLHYAVEMITKLEDNPDYNFKLCLKDRDLLAGVSFQHKALTQLIEDRCKHLIVILTENFLHSCENLFLVDYTQASQIQNKSRKIIPLLYEDSVVIPRTLKIYTHLKYNANAGSLFNFWDKLATSIRNVNFAIESSPVHTKKDNINLCAPQQTLQTDASRTSLINLYTPPVDIPSININGHAFIPEDDIPKKKERSKFYKRSSLHQSGNKLQNGLTRNASSTFPLNEGYYNTSVSMSNLSTTSYNEPKKKKKWSKLKKLFTRSSTNLKTQA